MKTLGVLMLAAAATGAGGLFDGLGKPHAHNRLFRPHVVQHGPPPPGGPIIAPPVDPALSGAGFGGNRLFANTTSQVFFVDPADMQIGWQTAGPDGTPVYLPAQLTVPARYNFRQGFIYRLKLTNIANNPGLVLYPTLEIAPSTPATDAYLTHNPIPVQLTQEDFDQVRAGNFVTKVVYLPDPKFQELAVAGLYGAETLVSTRLEPGIDPILEADKRGTILMIIRVGAIDLEMPASGSSENVVYGDADAYAPEPAYEQPPATLPPPEALTPPGAPLMEEPAVPIDPEVPPVAPAAPAAPEFDELLDSVPGADPSASRSTGESGRSMVSLSVPALPEPVAPPPVADDLPPLLP